MSDTDHPSFEFMQEVFGHLPLLIVQLTVDGIVLSANEQATRVTGYSTQDLAGKNWWGLLFPGKLFRQVPKFISAVEPPIGGNGVLRDVPMVIATKDGHERTIAWTRFTRKTEKGTHEIVLIGLDLTDRLTNADREATHVMMEPNTIPPVGEEIDGTIIKPIQASPPKLAEDHGHQAIQEVHEFLTQVDSRIDALEAALMIGELGHVACLADQLRNGARACGLLHVSTAAGRVFHAAAQGAMTDVTRNINDLVGLCRGNAKA